MSHNTHGKLQYRERQPIDKYPAFREAIKEQPGARTPLLPWEFSYVVMIAIHDTRDQEIRECLAAFSSCCFMGLVAKDDAFVTTGYA